MKLARSNILFFCLFFLVIFYPFEGLLLNHFGVELAIIRWFFALSVDILILSYIIRPNNHNDYNGLKIFYYLFLVWSIFLLFKTIPDILSNQYKLKLFITNSLVISLFPFLLNYNFDIHYIKRMIRLFSKISIFIILVFVTCPFVFSSGVTMEYLSYAFATPIGMLVLLSPYEKNTRKTFFHLIILLFFLVSCISFGRRAATLYILFFFVGTFVLNFNMISRDKYLLCQKRKNLLPIFIIVIIFFILCAVFSQNITYILERFDTGFESREGPIEEFLYDFNKAQDWLTGRGYVGEIMGGVLATTDQGTRFGIESGWLTLILHGGIPYALLILILCIEAIINALKSNNLLCKSFGLFIFYMIIDMTGFGVQFVNIKTVLFYIAISCCHSKYLLKLNNDDIIKYIYV